MKPHHWLSQTSQLVGSSPSADFLGKCGRKVTSKKWGAGLVIKLASFRDGSDPDGLKDICKLSRRWDSFADTWQPRLGESDQIATNKIDLSSQKTNKIQKPKLTSHLKKQNQNLTLISKNKTKIDLSSQKTKKLNWPLISKKTEPKLTSHIKLLNLDIVTLVRRRSCCSWHFETSKNAKKNYISHHMTLSKMYIWWKGHICWWIHLSGSCSSRSGTADFKHKDTTSPDMYLPPTLDPILTYMYIAKTIITYQLTSKYLHVLVLG